MSARLRPLLVLACIALLWWLAADGRTGSDSGGEASTEGRASETATPPGDGATPAGEAPAPEPTLDQRARSILPEASCVRPDRSTASGPAPRCVASLGRAITLGIAPGGPLAIVSLTHSATMSWSLPRAILDRPFDPLPADAEAQAIFVAEPGTRALFAVGSRILRYDTTSGRVADAIDGPGGRIGDLAATSDGSAIAVVASGDGQAHLLDATGTPVRTLATADRAARIAIDTTGSRAAVATEVGSIALFDLAGGAEPVVATPSLEPAAALAFGRDALYAAGSDGVLRALDPRSGTVAWQRDVGSPLVALALARGGRVAATGARDRVLRLHALPGGEILDALEWHRAGIAGLAFGAGPTLVSADRDGELAVWDLGGDGRRAAR